MLHLHCFCFQVSTACVSVADDSAISSLLKMDFLQSDIENSLANGIKLFVVCVLQTFHKHPFFPGQEVLLAMSLITLNSRLSESDV